MRNIDPHGVLAVGTGDGSSGANNFLISPFGQILQLVCGAVAIVVVLTCLFRAIKSVSMGRPGEGIKIFFWGALLGGMLFNLSLFVVLVGQLSGIIMNLFSSIGGITGQGHQ